MARTAYPTFATNDAFTASQANTYWRDNDLQYFPYTTAGDIQYAASPSTTSRLAIGAAYKLLRANSAGTLPEWGQAPFVVASQNNSTSYNYSSTTVRDMPNSSGTITPLVTSTVIIFARAEAANGAGNCWFWYRPRCNGVDSAFDYSILQYSGGIGVSVPAIAIFTGVTAGAKTIVLREREGYGAAVAYTVSSKSWIAIAVPE